MIKIAISGKAKTGKDTVADFMLDYLFVNKNLHYMYVTAFADPIKKIAQNMFPKIADEVLWGPSENRNAIIPEAFDENGNTLTCRKLLLDIGKNGRKYNPDIWIESIFDFLDSKKRDAQIIKDLRFKNEFKKCKEKGFILVRIVRPDNDYKSKDISEIDLDDVPDSKFDYVIVNNSSLNDLEKKTKEVIDLIVG